MATSKLQNEVLALLHGNDWISASLSAAALTAALSRVYKTLLKKGFIAATYKDGNGYKRIAKIKVNCSAAEQLTVLKGGKR